MRKSSLSHDGFSHRFPTLAVHASCSVRFFWHEYRSRRILPNSGLPHRYTLSQRPQNEHGQLAADAARHPTEERPAYTLHDAIKR